MKKHLGFFLLSLFFIALAISACDDGGDNGGGKIADAVIDLAAIPGVTPPAYGETPVTEITETDQYTGTVAWSPEDATFAATTVYTASITLTAKSGYTLTGVAEDFFTVAGADTVSNDADSGVVTAVFPAAGEINISAIPGVTAPVLGAIPVTEITETDQYTGSVTWDGGWAWCTRFGGQKEYTATITLTAKPGYTLTGVATNFFTVSGATSATNSADSGVITAVFPATASVGNIGDSALGGKVGYILQSGDDGYVAGEQRGLIVADAEQSTGIIWAVAAHQSIAVPGGTGTALGTGSSNTDNIIDQNSAGSTYAAGLARAYNGGGYTDWFLPSMDELNKLYINKATIGGFADDLYWSSSESESDAGMAGIQYFSNGLQFYDYKYSSCRVRAVRSF